MSQAFSSLQDDLNKVIQFSPPTVTADTPALDVIELMSQTRSSYVLVVEQQRLVGIFTEHDLLLATAARVELERVNIATLMPQSVVTLRQGDVQAITAVLNQFQKHQIRHLPVVDEQGNIVGVITSESVHQLWLKSLQATIEEQTADLQQEMAQREALMQTLIDREARYRAIVETQTALVVRTSPEGIITFVNEAACRISGYARETLVGRYWQDFIPAEDLVKLLDQPVIFTPETPSVVTEQCNLFATGKIWCQWTSHGIFDSQGQLLEIQSVGWDITTHKHTEAALRQSETRFQTLVQNMPGMSYRYLPGQDGVGRFLYVSSGASELLGLEPETILQDANSVWSLIHREDLPSLQSSVAISVQGCFLWCWEGRLTTPSGQNKWIQGKSRPEQTPDGMVWDGLLMDITERKQLELALYHSEEQRRLALDLSEVGMWDWQISTDQEVWSDQHFRLLGLQPGEVQPSQQVWLACIHPEDARLIQRLIIQNLQEQKNIEFEYRVLYPNGEIHWRLSKGQYIYNEAGEAIRAVGIIVDIDELKRSEAALRQSEARYLGILEDQTELIARFLPDGTLTFVNEAYCHYFGKTRKELIGKCYNPVILEADREQVAEQLRQISRSNPVVTIENRVVTGGEVRWTEWINRAIFGDQGQIVEFQTVGRDVDDRKQVEAELERAKRIAEAANQAKSSFLANMSHELRTPLNAILGFAQLMSHNPSLNLSQREHLEIINRNGEYLLQLINDVLSISKIEAGRLTLEENTLDLYLLLADLQTTFGLQAESKDLQFICEPMVNRGASIVQSIFPQYIQTDERKLRQILTNLLDNAIKFTEQGCITVRVEVGQMLETGWQSLTTSDTKTAPIEATHPDPFSSDRFLCFEVADTGPGIAPEELDTLFDAFVQAEVGRKISQGSGLGLAISQRFVELMGGTIAVNSQLGVGTVFSFTLPLKLAPMDALLPNPTSAPEIIGLMPGQSTYRIMVADDVAENRELLVQRLHNTGFEVIAASNGQEAIERWITYQPHLIWMDMRMPIMDGVEATQRIRSLEARAESPDQKVQTKKNQPHSRTIIIAITASVFEEDCQRMMSAGCDDCVTKPCPETIFFDKLSQYLGVRYAYEEFAANPVLVSTYTQAQLAKAIAEMPATWVTAINSAAYRARDREILQLIEQIPDSHSFLKDVIATLVDNFDLEKIIQLTTL
ncbi:MAG: PAS domain S-box protein [Scytolyngbya sp. HA4215-MV1]|jgi:PAS domain S-box-containing protein|nr:PAS domain S-box protein [Scytolyngbya sp. HA4215-MV1]